VSRRLRAAVALLAVASAPACGERAPPPDVVLVLVDTLRADRTALLPGGPPTTPELAALVAEGTSYTQAVAPSAWTLPSIASLFSGQDARAHALQGRPGLVTRHGADLALPALAERFRDGGYHTIGLVANPLLTEAAGYARGFDEYVLAPPGTTDDLAASIHDLRAWDAESLVARALSALATAPRDRPVFLYLHLMDAHVPYDPANEALAAPSPGWTEEAAGAPLVGWADALSPEQRRAIEQDAQRQKQAARQQEETARRDRALLSSYSSEAEIDLARKRSLQTIDSVVQSTLAYSEQLAKRKTEVEAKKEEMKGKPIAAILDRELESIDSELIRQNELIEQKKRETQMVIAKYDADKQRWRELVASRGAEDAKAPSTAEAAQPASAPSKKK